MKGGKQGGGGGRGGKPSRGGKSGGAGKPARGGKPGRGGGAGFGGKPSRTQKETFGGRSSLDDAPASSAPAGRGRNPRPRKPAATSTPSSAKLTVAKGGAPAPVAPPPADTKGAVIVQRTLNVPASAVIRAINDRDRREWAPQQLYRVVSVLAPRFIRLAFPDGTLVAVSVTRLGNARSAVAVELTKFPDSIDERELRDRWAHALAALQEQLDTAWD